ncbi:uncharacterized protein C11orf24 homolog [Mustela putorius furo]|uniref:Uncharacterized protein C11orf24 homolog n=1 Tax=Mustela putorius furo TaxID=9669 RepID=M3XZ05_MUSPF|nr:uncharacterized protein C11orf24 homolog [Mustela putorius furo]XP_004759616.1 uncharacterized protein C11orf24 homolog [Mustela putorius furo]
MWTALVLVWISSLSLSESQVPSQDARHLVLNQTDNPAKKSVSVLTVTRVLNGISGIMTAVTPSPVPLAIGTPVANASSPAVTAGRTLRTDEGTEGSPEQVASRAPQPPAPAASQRTPSSTAVRVPHTQVPSGSPLPGTAALTTLATSAQPTTGPVMTAHAPMGTHSPSQHTPGNSTASPTATSGSQVLNVSTQAPAVQASTGWPTADTARGPTPTLSSTASEPTRPSVTPVATTAGTTTTAHAQEPTTSSAPSPVPPTSPTPKGEATSPTTRLSPAPSTPGAAGPGTARTPEHVPPETPPGTASSAPTPGAPGSTKMSATDLCPLSTQGQYVVVTTRPLSPSLVNKGFLLAALFLGVALFVVVVVLLALQAYESYRKKEYTQVDYLINGMYADSEM